MPFRITARVISQLGAELISSDEVALYELVKNGFDAGSRKVTISVVYRVSPNILRDTENAIRKLGRSFEAQKAVTVVRAVLQSLSEEDNLDRATIDNLLSEIAHTESQEEALDLIRKINRIEVLDSGSGMCKKDVSEFFLTVGTTHRRLQHEAFLAGTSSYPSEVPPAGEKWIGRLSAMRLGKRLQLDTWQVNQSRQVQLKVNWRWFEDNPDADPEDYKLEPREQSRTIPKDEQGTRLIIYDLNASWTLEKITSLAMRHLIKFIDPFALRSRRAIAVKWNEQVIDLGSITQTFLAAAHNGMKGRATISATGEFRLEIDYSWSRMSRLLKA